MNRYHVRISGHGAGERAVKVIQAYRYALDPSAAQERMLRFPAYRGTTL